MVRLEPTWLKNWIPPNRVPHVRSGVDRGVRFTAAHILGIGSLLPDPGDRDTSGVVAPVQRCHPRRTSVRRRVIDRGPCVGHGARTDDVVEAGRRGAAGSP